ncbi:bifunctional diaminohydroxyphosphoribosylaminopyrimidine deaminase/5-amino-6-(5-phosphoribosylamino)uracil reductase RibD [Moraxella oblonga]|uniref:bifunctional diaminohydroxyphosphoribosylaminopyrimidine deaminase/5-amino-6-(5-phosphoribosylamino)uracil reductase RibD n=1 Tax=Moraxella oblonga TaxID=200413 RepID=UPI0009FE11E7|nr:bifunctional diaminohydroxyphosphoribosylaminopyrimidine deaminase/5-amino-6-(5-phosphoribosylamino)uracil reductase RibD [Moraxella oblonga]
MTTLSLLSPSLIAQLSPSLPDDETFMTMAIEEAKQGIYTTRPNPVVGCVIVKDGEVLGKGFHPKAGLPHAEIFALNNAKEQGFDVVGASAYVTLEPCSHFGRTPPCANALINSGVARVVVACLDPNPKVAGSGVAMLMGAGIAVSVGVCQDEAQRLNHGFLKAMAVGMPFVRLKLGISLDGRVAMANGQSKWITGEQARSDVQRLRAMSGAIVTGSGTILADNPSLNVRANIDGTPPSQIPPPKIVVVDRSGKLHAKADLTVLQNSDTLIWQGDLNTLLKTLVADYQIYDVLVEAGATLAGAFLQAGLVDELIVYQAPCLLGVNSKPMFLGDFDDLKDKLNFELKDTKQIGQDVRLTLTPIVK